jgi:uncharacterized membrane protein YdjX (TVP38/TMEM64 family)
MAAACRWVLLGVLGAVIALAWFYGDYASAREIHHLVARMGAWAPAVFIFLYALAPVLLVPGLPFDLAAGVLFGPVWGTVFASIGSTAGATAALLVARTLGRDWAQRRVSGRLARITAGVEAQGWRFVAFARLIPVIPFNLLNFALGLTRIGLVPYVVASFIFMLPATAIYVYAGWAAGEAALGIVPPGPALVRAGVALSALGVLAIVTWLVKRRVPPSPSPSR